MKKIVLLLKYLVTVLSIMTLGYFVHSKWRRDKEGNRMIRNDLYSAGW